MNNMKMEQEYPIRKVDAPHPIVAAVPGSKSITNRALLIAALADGKSILRGVLFSDDSRHFLAALQDLGFGITISEPDQMVVIEGMGGRIPKKEAAVDVGSAGTAARFLTAFLGLSGGTYHMNSSEQMKKRPMKDLLEALESLGACIEFAEEDYHFPYTIGNLGCKKHEVTVDVDKSSQFLSALLMVSVLFKQDFVIHVTGNHGMAYVRMTVEMMRQFGLEIQVSTDGRTYVIPAEGGYCARDYQIEPDLSAACYFYGAGAILGVSAKVMHVHREGLQGDIQFLSILEDMGCSLREEEDGILVLPPVKQENEPFPKEIPKQRAWNRIETTGLRGGKWDLSTFSDQALTLAAIAPFTDSGVEIQNVGHIKYQE